ncbi:hypothetical protein GF385_02090 [Candidatus Dependentiae bacterium]|nr:hypothetical protein [Candidatus Dependentiae bacterium]
MKKIKVFILFLFVSLSINSVNIFGMGDLDSPKKKGRVERFKESLKKFLKEFENFLEELPQKAKKKINSLDYDELEELNFTFPMSFGEKNFSLGFKWSWEKGPGDVSLGFSPIKGELISPSFKNLGLSGFDRVANYGVLNVILGIGTTAEERFGNLKFLEPIIKPIRGSIGIKNLDTLRNFLTLKSIYVFYIKLILLAKTYVPQKRFSDLSKQMMFLLLRLVQTVNIEKTIIANNGERNPAKWTKRVYYADPREFIDKLPKFIQNILNRLQIPITSYGSFREWQDKKRGFNEYDKQLSETMRRSNLDSEIKYAKENLQPLFEKTNPTLTDAKMITYLCARWVYNKSNAKRNDSIKFLGEFILASIQAVQKINTSDNNLKKYKDMLIAKLNQYFKMLASDESIKNEPLVDDFNIIGKKSVNVVTALSYYMYLLKYNMSYPFYGDPGYLFSDAKLGKEGTRSFAIKLALRAFKDSKKAINFAKQISDVIATDSDGNPIEKDGNYIKIGKQAYKNIIGETYLNYMNAKKLYNQASSRLKQAKAKSDPMISKYEQAKKTAMKSYLKAKKGYIFAKNKFTIRVIRYFKFKRAEELPSETVMRFILRELKRVSLRSKQFEPAVKSINEFFKEFFGIEDMITMSDLGKEPEFDEEAIQIEEQFDYSDIGETFEFEGFEEEQFAF